jgi:hypothetical protein
LKDDGPRPRKLGGGGVVVDSEFLDAIEAGQSRNRTAAVEIVGEGGAVEQDIVRALAQAIDMQVAIAVGGHAGNGLQQIPDAAAIERQLVDAGVSSVWIWEGESVITMGVTSCTLTAVEVPEGFKTISMVADSWVCTSAVASNLAMPGCSAVMVYMPGTIAGKT